jgi:hypothetical protein
MVERTFPDGLQIPLTAEGAAAWLGVVERNGDLGVTWVHTYVSEDKRRTYCVYDGPSPEAPLSEVRNGPYELLGVEYVVIAEAWHARNEAPPVLMGQLFNYVGSPNRYGIPAF